METSGERQITLTLGLKEELDVFKDRLHERWLELNTPLTVGQERLYCLLIVFIDNSIEG